MRLAHGRVTTIAAVRVGVGFMADKIGVHTLCDPSPKTSPPFQIAEAIVAFPLPCSSWQGLASFHAQGKQDCCAHVAGAHHMALLVVALQCPCCSPMPGQLLLGGRAWCQEH